MNEFITELDIVKFNRIHYCIFQTSNWEKGKKVISRDIPKLQSGQHGKNRKGCFKTLNMCSPQMRVDEEWGGVSVLCRRVVLD